MITGGEEYKRAKVLQTPVKMSERRCFTFRSRGSPPTPGLWWGCLKMSIVGGNHRGEVCSWRTVPCGKGQFSTEAVHEVLWPTRRIHLEEVHGGLSIMRGLHCGAGDECEEAYLWRTRSSRNMMNWAQHPFHLLAPVEGCRSVRLRNF